MRHPQGTDLLKIEGQCCIPNFPCAVEQKCNINTVSFASGLLLGGWGGIPRVVKQPLKLSSRPQECKRSLFPPPMPVVAGARPRPGLVSSEVTPLEASAGSLWEAQQVRVE